MLQFFVIAVFFSLGVCEMSEIEIDRAWNSFKMIHEKSYPNLAEEIYRKSLFRAKYNHIIEFNNAGHSYTKRLNKFSDMTFVELRPFTLTGISNLTELGSRMGERIRAEELYGPPSKNGPFTQSEYLDYRESGSVTPVKNQGNCGSSWSFSVAASLEGTQHVATGKLVPLSEQHQISCFGKSCQGQFPDEAIDWILENNGLATEACYPYTSGDGDVEVCQSVQQNCIGAVTKNKISPQYADEQDLKTHLDIAGPISVSHYLTNDWADYKSGVFDDPDCIEHSKDDEDETMFHATAIVGYGQEDGLDYWLVKNSWGADTQDGGYIKMARNKDSQCEIAHWGVYATV